MTPMSRMDFSPASHTDAMQLGDRSDAPAAATNGRSILFVRVIREIRGLPRQSLDGGAEIISAFPRRVFGKQDRSAMGPRSDRA
jgi:hypothetical protein